VLHMHVSLTRELADSHPEDIEVPKHAASCTHQLVGVSMTIRRDPGGLEQGVYSASRRASMVSMDCEANAARKRRSLGRAAREAGRAQTPGAADCSKGAPKVPPRNTTSAVRVEHAATVHAGKHWACNPPSVGLSELSLIDTELFYGYARVGAAAHE
jgi:hypothetical protein